MSERTSMSYLRHSTLRGGHPLIDSVCQCESTEVGVSGGDDERESWGPSVAMAALISSPRSLPRRSSIGMASQIFPNDSARWHTAQLCVPRMSGWHWRRCSERPNRA